jgi:hypothetical protein
MDKDIAIKILLAFWFSPIIDIWSVSRLEKKHKNDKKIKRSFIMPTYQEFVIYLLNRRKIKSDLDAFGVILSSPMMYFGCLMVFKIQKNLEKWRKKRSNND